jgi:DNA-binding NtrC family response regulator
MFRILAIDDSISALQVTETILAEAGYEVRTCSEGKRALELLEQEPFDLVITDIYMPDLDGLEVIQEEHRIRPNVPIVAVSGVTGARNMLKVARHMGACQTVQKPFSKAGLIAAVEAALGARRAVPCEAPYDDHGTSIRRPAGNMDVPK